jgi:hypothetical protein
MSLKRFVFITAALIMALPVSALAQDKAVLDEAAQEAELAKQSQNPVANMISIPFEFWHNEGPNGKGFTALVKPVIPTSLGKINLINRFILPYASISGTIQPPGTEFSDPVVDEKGLADFTYQGFLSPANPSALIWGAGLALQMPTASSDYLGTNYWALGPSLLALTMPGNWVVGVVLQNIWDFAGSGEGGVNMMTLQPILSYQLGDGWYLTSTPVITANWNAESDDIWTVPLGGGVGKMQKIGKMPVDFKLVYYNNVSKPTFGADWSVLLGVKLILPQ